MPFLQMGNATVHVMLGPGMSLNENDLQFIRSKVEELLRERADEEKRKKPVK